MLRLFHKIRLQSRGMYPFVFIFALRWVGWVIAIFIIYMGDRPPENSRYEPALLIGTFLYIAALTAYVPLARMRLLTRLGVKNPESGSDLLVLGGFDLAVLFGILYFSGGFNTPYYHYANVSLVFLTYLLGWRGSLTVMLVYLVGFTTIIAVAGEGTDGVWANAEVYSIPAIFLTPVMVVLGAQFLSWLIRQADEQREQVREAFEETSALYGFANSVAQSESSEQMLKGAVEALIGASNFVKLAVCEVQGSSLRERSSLDGLDPVAFALQPSEMAALQEASEAVLLASTARYEYASPVHVQGLLWGAVAFSLNHDAAPERQTRLATSLAAQLGLGLTKLALSRQREQLAAQEERNRIAREIHDGVAQSIYMLSLNLTKASELAETEAVFGERLNKLVGVAKRALLEVRQYVFDLKPMLAGQARLVDMLQGQCREFSAVSGLPVDLNVEGEEGELPLEVVASFYRIAQEALANSFRHARATRVSLDLRFGTEGLEMEIRDNGDGFRPGDAPKGNGLENMRRRTADLGGQFDLRSSTREGTAVCVTIPLRTRP